MIDINMSLFIQMANFLVLLVLLNFLLFKPIRAILKQRADKMAGLAADAEKSKQSHQEAAEELKAVVREAQAEGVAHRNALKGEAFDREKELLDKVNAEMEAESKQVLAQIKDQMEGARASLRDQADGFSVSLAEKILGRSLT